MGPAQAIKTCLAKSFKFKGRAARSEFWWFTPPAIAIVFVASWVILPNFVVLPWYGTWIMIFLALLPVWACGARRLQDTGENGTEIFIPASIFFGFPIATTLLLFAGAAFHGIMFFFLVIFVALPLLGIGIFAAFVSLGPTIGQLIVPSDTGENAFGPNPNEAPS